MIVSPCSAATKIATPRASPSASVDWTLAPKNASSIATASGRTSAISSRSPRPISASRVARPCRADAEITPHSTYRTVAARRPRTLDDAVTEAERTGIDAQDAQGTVERSTCRQLNALEDGLVDVHVRVHVLHVVIVLQRVDQLDRAYGVLAGQMDDVLRHHRHLGVHAARAGPPS